MLQLNLDANSTKDIYKNAEKAVPKEFLRNLKDPKKPIGVDWRNKNFFGVNNELKSNLTFTIEAIQYDSFKVRISTANETRFQIPDSMVPVDNLNSDMRLDMYSLKLFQEPYENFGFQIRDIKDPSNWFLDSRNQTLIFADKYIQMDFKLVSQNVYGLGDRYSRMKLLEGAYGMWSKGGAPLNFKGRGGLSGVHPFAMFETAKNRRFVGIFFRNSNQMTPVVRFNDDGTSTLSFITIGGELEMYFFMQGTGQEVIQSYHNLIGKPRLPPFWALGWQEASPAPVDFPATHNQQAIIEAVKQYQNKGLPLEAIYTQQDSWDQVRDFTLNSKSFENITDLMTTLASNNQKLVAYVDPSINVNLRYKNPTYIAGNKIGAFIKSAIQPNNPDGYLVNYKRLTFEAVYVDWLNNKSYDFWQTQILSFQKKLPFDGLWTTNNEPYGDLDGEKIYYQKEQERERTERMLKESEPEPEIYDQTWFYSFWPLNVQSTYNLPFIPQFEELGNFDKHTISLNSTHEGGVQELNVHSLYAHAMMQATYHAVTNQSDNRPFLVSSGSFSSSGRYTSVAHTSYSTTWEQMYYGLQSVIRSSMFGISQSGVDVCGQGFYGGDLKEEVCFRWYQLATFFPLARHAQYYYNPRTEPFYFQTRQDAIKKTMHDRMQYLRLMYTCMFESSRDGGSCLEPIEFRYPVDSSMFTESIDDVSASFIFARAIKVSPTFSPGNETISSYFPQGNWVNLANWTDIVQGQDNFTDVKLGDTITAHLAPGALIPWQNNSAMDVMTTLDLLQKPISLVANRDRSGFAQGTVFLDEGNSMKELSDKNYDFYSIFAQANSVQFKASPDNKNLQKHHIDQIVLVNAVDLKTVDFACYFSPDSLMPFPLFPQYNETLNALIIKPRQQLKFSAISNIYYGSIANKDINLCYNDTTQTFDYKIKDSDNPNIEATNITGLKQVSYILQKLGPYSLGSINLTLGFFDSGIINVKWTWEVNSSQRQLLRVPDLIIDSSSKANPSKIQGSLEEYVDIQAEPFQIMFKTRVNQKYEPILTIQGFLFDQYLNWVNLVAYGQPTERDEDFKGIIGLGERAQKDFFLKSGVYSIWARDIDNSTQDGKLTGKQTYGSHPFYMYKHRKQSWVGVFHNQMQAQDWWVKNDHTHGQISISNIATGGYGDIFVLLSSQKPESVLTKYQRLIGAPVLTPLWALGWNQCKRCYRTLQEVQDSMQGYIDNGIPLDAQWVDIDYMQDYKDFTYNGNNSFGEAGAFSGLRNFVDDLHKQNMRFVPTIDAGIAMRPNQGYLPYDQGLKQDIFMKLNGQLYYGKSWANEVVYPDWFSHNAQSWWAFMLDYLYDMLPFDGLWQDMNEASNFCNGLCHQDDTLFSQKIMTRLPYMPTGASLETKAISLDVQNAQNFTQLDAHSLFGTLQVRASHEWFKKRKQNRTMVISRSSFAGHGKYGSLRLGDNYASVEDMEISVIGAMKMNIFGIPLVGSDICGFGGNSTTAQLCTRWHQVGAFQPFSRNHRACWGNPQEPWRFNTTIFDGNVTYTDLMREAIFRKYHLIRYYYTQMSQLSFGNSSQYHTVYKPLFFEFPDEDGAYEDIANNVMIGPALKISVNAKNLTQENTDFYFPAGTWCSLFEPIGDCFTSEIGQSISLPSRLNESFVHLREGFILPMQNATALGARTTVDLQNAPVDLHILGSFKVPGIINWQAEGSYVNDDGLTTQLDGNVNLYSFTAVYSQDPRESLTITFQQSMVASNYFSNQTNCTGVNLADSLHSIYIYNADSFKQKNFYHVEASFINTQEAYTIIGNASYDADTNRLVFHSDQYLCISALFRLVIRNVSP